MLGTVLSALLVLVYSLQQLKGQLWHCPHLTHETTEAQRNQRSCPMSHYWQDMKPGFKSVWLQVCVLVTKISCFMDIIKNHCTWSRWWYLETYQEETVIWGDMESEHSLSFLAHPFNMTSLSEWILPSCCSFHTHQSHQTAHFFLHVLSHSCLLSCDGWHLASPKIHMLKHSPTRWWY